MGYETFQAYIVEIWLLDRKHQRGKLGKEGSVSGKNTKSIKSYHRRSKRPDGQNKDKPRRNKKNPG